MHNVNDLSIEYYIYKELPNNLPVEDNNDELPAIQQSVQTYIKTMES
jgi:hypothetical protein